MLSGYGDTILSCHPIHGLISRENHTLKRYMDPPTLFIAALYTIAQTWEQPKYLSTYEWIMKMWYICTKYYSAKKRNNTICSHNDGPSDYHTKWNKLEQDNIYITYAWTLKSDTNELIFKMETNSRLRSLWIPEGNGEQRVSTRRLEWTHIHYYM